MKKLEEKHLEHTSLLLSWFHVIPLMEVVLSIYKDSTKHKELEEGILEYFE